ACHPAVREAVVVVREDTPGLKQLVAYFIRRPQASDEATSSIADLRHFLAEQLPDYMLPAAFVELPAFPLTPHGKLDRRALPKPDQDTFLTGEAMPQTPTEQLLVDIWSALLGKEQIGRYDNFFMLG